MHGQMIWFEPGGHMAAMGKLLSSQGNRDPSSDEIAQERVAMLAVHKEMSEADEANLLEEEDMHVFGQVPLSDRFSLVSCNSCRKPVKVSQYAAHAERCKSLLSDQDINNGAARRHLQKQRNGMLGEADVCDAALDSGTLVSDLQPGGFPTSITAKGKKCIRPKLWGCFSYLGAEVSTGPKVGRPRKLSVCNPREMSDGSIPEESEAGLQSEGLSSSGKRRKPYLPFTMDDLDVMCGVPSPRSGAPCRQPLTCKSHSISSKRAVTGRRKPFDALLQDLKDSNSRKAQQTDIPRPLATKVYCASHNQRVRSVINCLYRESISGRSGLSQNEQILALEANPQQQHMLMSLSKTSGLQ